MGDLKHLLRVFDGALAEALIPYSMRPTRPASYNPLTDVWQRPYSAGHEVKNQLAEVLIELQGKAIAKADNPNMLVAITAAAALDKYSRIAGVDWREEALP